MTYDLVIIGGGPAGITAGIYAKRQGLNALLITKSFGGQMERKAIAIENYPGFEEVSGMKLVQKFERHLRKQKVEIERDLVTKVKKIGKNFLVLTKSKNHFQARAVIIASGADPRPLEVPGEKKFIGRGVSYCTICDGALFSGKTVAIIGGGNAGFEAAIFLSKLANRIYILEYSPKTGADQINQERVKKIGKVKVITSASLKKIQGKKFIESLTYQNLKSKQLKTIKLDGIFIEIGSQPATSFVKDLVDFNKKDEIRVNLKTNQTKTPGLFAAGDVTEIRDKQIVIAAGEGAKAALSAYNYLQKI
jgi:alkyl hydroperoxide reductase subunit F